jgi:glycosyltransferase involved in cell wall biosynthesis
VELSVIVCAHNEQATLPQQLDALLAQKWAGEWEVVVVDNRSTDGTSALVSRYAATNPRVRLVRANKSSGQSYAMNVGVQAARADLLAFCDADDVVAPGWVAAMASGLRDHAIVTGPHELDLLNPTWLADSRGRTIEETVGSFAGIFPCVRGAGWGVRRSAWDRVGGMSEDYQAAQDIDFSLRAWLAGIDIAGLPDAVVHYRYRDTPRALWRQGFTYGRHRPRIARLLKEHGKPTPPALAGWKSWLLLLTRLPTLVTPSGRAIWMWIAGNRVGQVVGSVRERTLML